MAHPDWGSVDNRLTRKTPASYSDGVYTMDQGSKERPSPRSLSQAFMQGTDGKASVRNRTALLAFFGQVVTSEILMASEMPSCPIEVSKIPISRCDETYDANCDGETTMPFYRAQYDAKTGQSPNMPREQKNHMTAWIDGSFIYSTTEPCPLLTPVELLRATITCSSAVVPATSSSSCRSLVIALIPATLLSSPTASAKIMSSKNVAKPSVT